MATIPESPVFAPQVYQIETDDPVLGGPDGAVNLQAKQLADRTAYLKEAVEDAASVAAGADAKADDALAQIAQVEADAGSAAASAAAALQHRNAAQAAEALAVAAKNAAEAASAQAGDNAAYAVEAAGLAQQKASEAQAAATAAVSASGMAAGYRDAAQAARDAAVSAKDAAEDARDDAQSAASTATGAKVAAEAARDAAASSAAAADADRIAAEAAKDALFNDLASSDVGKGASLVAYTPAGTGAVATTVQAKLRETVSVKDFGAVGDGVTDDTAAIQAALNYWVANNCDLLFPAGGVYSVASPLVAAFSSGLSLYRKRITGYGARLLGTFTSGDLLKITVTGSKTLVRRLVIEGLEINSSSTNGYALVMQGPLASDSYLYNNVIRDITATGFGGISLLGNFFESTVQDCHISCPISASSGYGIFIDTSGGSGGGSGGVISSLTLFQNTTRGGINGVRVSATSNDVNIIGGTYLQAWNEGINNQNAQGGYIKGAHVEANWRSNSSLTTGQAGIYAVISGGTFSIEDTFAFAGTGSGQAHTARVFVSPSGCARLGSGRQFGGNEQFYIDGNVGSTAILSGKGTFLTFGNIRVTQIDGDRVRVPIASNRVTRVTGGATRTPSAAQTVLHISMNGTNTINPPSFTPVAGDELEFVFEQGGNGNDTVTWDPVYLRGSFVPATGFGRISTIRFRCVNRTSGSPSLVWVPIATGFY